MSQKILLLENDPNDEVLTLRAFRKKHITPEVVVLRDGAMAIDYISSSPNNVGAIFLNLKLPKVDGEEILRRVRAHASTKLIPIVILTSSEEDELIAMRYRAGANLLLRKPINGEALDAVMKELGLRWFKETKKTSKPNS